MGPTELKILKAVQANPGCTIAQVCRILNGKTLIDCWNCKDKLNPSRRKKVRADIPGCKPRLSTVRKGVFRLRKRRILEGERVRVGDSRMARGWDLVLKLKATI